MRSLRYNPHVHGQTRKPFLGPIAVTVANRKTRCATVVSSTREKITQRLSSSDKRCCSSTCEVVHGYRGTSSCNNTGAAAPTPCNNKDAVALTKQRHRRCIEFSLETPIGADIVLLLLRCFKIKEIRDYILRAQWS